MGEAHADCLCNVCQQICDRYQRRRGVTAVRGQSCVTVVCVKSVDALGGVGGVFVRVDCALCSVDCRCSAVAGALCYKMT